MKAAGLCTAWRCGLEKAADIFLVSFCCFSLSRSPSLFSHLQQASRPTFFARKFEASVSQEIINQLDSYLFGAYPSGTPSLQAYWENIYEQQADGLASLSDSAASHYGAFARMGLTRAASSLQGHPSDSSCRYDPHKFSQAQISASLVLRPLYQPLALPFTSVLLHRWQSGHVERQVTTFGHLKTK